MSYRTSITPHRRDGTDLVMRFRDGLRKAFLYASKRKRIRQADIAREIGVDRSSINRQLRGDAEISVMRIGEIASILGYQVQVRFVRDDDEGSNYLSARPLTASSGSHQVTERSDWGSQELTGPSPIPLPSIAHGQVELAMFGQRTSLLRPKGAEMAIVGMAGSGTTIASARPFGTQTTVPPLRMRMLTESSSEYETIHSDD